MFSCIGSRLVFVVAVLNATIFAQLKLIVVAKAFVVEAPPLIEALNDRL